MEINCSGKKRKKEELKGKQPPQGSHPLLLVSEAYQIHQPYLLNVGILLSGGFRVWMRHPLDTEREVQICTARSQFRFPHRFVWCGKKLSTNTQTHKQTLQYPANNVVQTA